VPGRATSSAPRQSRPPRRLLPSRLRRLPARAESAPRAAPDSILSRALAPVS
jgi:hypothetical protein